MLTSWRTVTLILHNTKPSAQSQVTTDTRYCNELQEVLLYCFNIISKSARGLYNPYLIVIMYITMYTFIN